VNRRPRAHCVQGGLPSYRARSKPIQGPGVRQVLVDDPSGSAVEAFEARG